MNTILSMQDFPREQTPGEEKVSMVSYLKCNRSDVSVLLCTVIG